MGKTFGQDTPTVPLYTQVYKWVPANLMQDNSAMDEHPIQGGIEILLVALVAIETRISSGLMGHLARM